MGTGSLSSSLESSFITVVTLLDPLKSNMSGSFSQLVLALALDPTLHAHLQWASVKRLIQTQMTILYLSLFCLLINNNSTVVPNALSQVTHTCSGEKLKKKCFSGKTGDKPRASLKRQLNGRVTHTCKLSHYNKMCSRTFKTVINNNRKK